MSESITELIKLDDLSELPEIPLYGVSPVNEQEALDWTKSIGAGKVWYWKETRTAYVHFSWVTIEYSKEHSLRVIESFRFNNIPMKVIK